MLIYEHKRTEEIVERLVKAAIVVRGMIIFVNIFVGIVSSMLLLLLITGSPVVAVILSVILGGVIGYQIGSGMAGVAMIIIEWMAQLLIAQGAIVANGQD